MASKRINVDRLEYDALCDLRDGEHERLKVQLSQARENYAGCLAVNATQLARLTSQDLTLAHLHQQVAALEKRVAELTPPRLDVGEQPLFKRR